MTIPSTARKAGPLLGTGAQTAWPFTFKVLAEEDVAVTIADSDGVETDLVLNTHYSVALNANQETSPGGTVTYPVAGSPLPTGSVLAIVGNLDYDQPLDLPSGGNFSPLALENQLDRATMQIQQLAEGLDRAARLPVTSAEDADALVADIVRIADSADNLDTVAENITSVNVVAADLSEPVSEINTVAASIDNVNAVGGSIANVNTVAGIAANVNTVAGIAANVSTVAGIAADVSTVADNVADISTVAGIAADVETVANNVADITNFADVWQGPHATDPTLRNDGSALQSGDLYFNTIENALRAYSGTVWVAGAAGSVSVQTFSGDGIETEFALTTAPVSENNAQIYIDGVYQQKSQFNITGTALTFSVAPPVGADNIEVVTVTALALGETDAALVSYVPAGTGAAATSVQSKLREFISVKDFGAGAAKTAAQNLTAFNAAVAATPTGGTLLINADTSFYAIDTSGGLSTAIEIDRKMTLVFEGDVKANFGTMQANPPYIFKVTADDVRFEGNGALIGDGSIDDTNAGTEATFPGLVYVTGDNFKFIGPKIDTPPKLGILLYDCIGARILSSTFTGGPTAYTTGNTAYFGVRAYLGGGHIISKNTFTPNTAGGMYVTCIFGSGSNDNLVEGNVAIKPYEKMAYLYGDRNIQKGNATVGNTATIPGTAQKGTITSVYRAVGSFNKIIGNSSDYCLAGATVMDGVYNDISGNTFSRCGQSAVAVFPSGSGYTGGFDGTTIKDNIGTAVAMTGVTLQDGVLFNTDYADSANVDVSGNNMSGFADSATEAQVRVIATAPYALRYSNIHDNTVRGGTNGLITDRVVSSVMHHNYAYNTSTQGFTETGGANNRWLHNHGESAQIGIAGLAASSEGSGNSYTSASLTGIATLSAAVVTTVAHGGVAANARIFLQEANVAAGLLPATKGRCYTARNGTGFDVAIPNGTAAAGTEQFFYQIQQ